MATVLTTDERIAEGARAARTGMLVSALLAAVKLIAGILGNTYALVADAIESSTDVVSSSIVLGGLKVAGREPDEDYPFGYGKAEPLASAAVALLLCAAGCGVAIAAVREIETPNHTPAWWTLLVLAGVLVIKAILFRRVSSVGVKIGSRALQGDAIHHMSDALT
ncbi:MAG: cation diffusion facilitator family transporter, partial [Acidobacteriota bacterium]